MDMVSAEIWEWIAACLADEANSEQREFISNWRKQHIENEKTYQALAHAWQAKPSPKKRFDSQKAFKKLDTKIQKK
jgi:ferric-dicitrate binding protein FerR (iron transport regulator)